MNDLRNSGGFLASFFVSSGDAFFGGNKKPFVFYPTIMASMDVWHMPVISGRRKSPVGDDYMVSKEILDCCMMTKRILFFYITIPSC